jgi:hypothetical protein
MVFFTFLVLLVRSELNISEGTIFKRKNDIFIHEGEAGKRNRMISGYRLAPVSKEDYCSGDDGCQHFNIEGEDYHRPLYCKNNRKLIQFVIYHKNNGRLLRLFTKAIKSNFNHFAI